ncbi:replicative DNA helicase [Streptomyces sp. H27-H1]|uniref:DnaB-like helicase N-terminal domain-containing protein n=1 Tax=Streptomyces sp. H27-H1 TaxID=2996461 RepID=UPI0022700BC7|nr:DnaB-like helicase N-terminal domain-containing protein [Streptomyces sp. H27-H1]MCY0928195.1 replicative DNA helicase [Streptomyces sp. H27-H1]
MANNRIPEADFGLEDIPAGPPVHYAEQALLGALLLDPYGIKAVGPLEAAHFSSARHRALFAAVATLTPPASPLHAKEPVWINAVHAHALPNSRGLALSYLHTLAAACPEPAHAHAYARMVRADHARRTVRAHSEVLIQAATDTGLPDPATVTLSRADSLAALLDHLAAAFPSHPGSLPRTPLPPPPARDTGPDVVSEEELLLSTAAAYPAALSSMRWLRPEDFAVPLHGALYRCLTSLAARGDPVDEVTVLWEAQQHGLLTEAFTAQAALDMLAASAGVPEHWGEQILRRSLLHHAHTTGRHIQAFTHDPANSPHQLVTGSRRALADLTSVRARWQHVTSQTPAERPRPRPAPASRAGPPTPRTTRAPTVSTRSSR